MCFPLNVDFFLSLHWNSSCLFFFRMTSHNLTWERTSWFPSSIILCWPCFFEVGPVSHKYEYLITLCSHSSGSPWDKSVFRGRLVFQLIGLEGPIENTYVSRLLSQSSSYPLMHMTSEQRQFLSPYYGPVWINWQHNVAYSNALMYKKMKLFHTW